MLLPLWNHAVRECHLFDIIYGTIPTSSCSLNSSHDINVPEDSALKGVKFMKTNVRKNSILTPEY